MNMGPVRNRSRSSDEPDSNRHRGRQADVVGTAENGANQSGDLHARLAEMADQVLRESPDADTSSLVRKTRLNEVRSKIASGYYSRPELKQAIAEKLFDSLDL